MHAGKTAALALLGLALLWSAPASSTLSIAATDGWYRWQVDGTAMTLFLYQENSKPVHIRILTPDCRVTWHGRKRIGKEVVDMGTLSLDDSVALLLDIARGKEHGMDVREEALFGLAQSGSDTAFEYFDQLIFAQKK